jgi:hypothetical protein
MGTKFVEDITVSAPAASATVRDSGLLGDAFVVSLDQPHFEASYQRKDTASYNTNGSDTIDPAVLA